MKLNLFVLGFIFSFLSLGHVQAEMVPALKYKGLILSGSELTTNSCEFYVALDPGLDALNSEFIIGYTTILHGQTVAPGLADFFYFDPQAALGASFYPVDQPQDDSVLTMSSIVLRPTSPVFGSDVTPNDIPTLNQNRDIQTSMVLTFKEGLSFENYINTVYDFVSDPSAVIDQTVINSVDLLTILFWDSGHYDRVRCSNLSFDSVTMADVDFQHVEDAHNDDEDHSGHDH